MWVSRVGAFGKPGAILSLIIPLLILFAINNDVGVFLAAHSLGRDQRAVLACDGERESRWSLLPAHFVKINVDAS